MTLLVGTFNLRLYRREDSPNHWEGRLPLVRRVLQELPVDIWGFQEVMPRQMEDLKEVLPNHGWHGQGRENRRGGGEGCYLFWHPRAELEVVEKETFWLGPDMDSPRLAWDAACPRICNQVVFRRGNSQFQVLNTHLDHVGVESRTRSAELLVERIQRSSLPSILMGDFNVQEATRRLPALAVLQDAAELHGVGPEGTYHAFTGEARGGAIDFVLLSPHFEVHFTQLLRDSEGPVFLSDHFPLLAQLELRLQGDP